MRTTLRIVLSLTALLAFAACSTEQGVSADDSPAEADGIGTSPSEPDQTYTLQWIAVDPDCGAALPSRLHVRGGYGEYLSATETKSSSVYVPVLEWRSVWFVLGKSTDSTTSTHFGPGAAQIYGADGAWQARIDVARNAADGSTECHGAYAVRGFPRPN